MYIAIKYTAARWSLYTCCLIVEKHEIVNWKQKLEETYVSLDSKLLWMRTGIYKKKGKEKKKKKKRIVSLIVIAY